MFYRVGVCGLRHKQAGRGKRKKSYVASAAGTVDEGACVLSYETERERVSNGFVCVTERRTDGVCVCQCTDWTAQRGRQRLKLLVER